MTHALLAQQAGFATPNNEKGPTVAAVAPQETTNSEGLNSPADGISWQAPRRWRSALRGRAKHGIVTAACWGFPATWARWMIVRGGLGDA